MKTLYQKETWKYTLLGTLFGCLFPILASFIQSWKQVRSINWETIVTIQATEPLLWIIDTVPFFLGLFAYFIGKKMDIIHQKNEEILHMNQQLIAQDQIALVGKMTAGIAHEIKNPLNFVSNFAEGSVEIVAELTTVLTTGYRKKDWSNFDLIQELMEELRQNAIDIQENSERANKIVFDLMDQTNNKRKVFKKVNINELIEESMNLSLKSFKAEHPLFKLNIKKELCPDLATVPANSSSLSRVLINILNNACDAVRQKKTRFQLNYQPKLSIQTVAEPDGVQIKIRDNGLGIPATIKEKIFIPFFSTKPSGAGNTGLGLSISHDIIFNEHHGQISVESEEGEYTEFCILIPAS